MKSRFAETVIEIVRSIPEGHVAAYGWIAVLAGNPRGARTVSWILHSSSKKMNLPWHRVIGSAGKISLPRGGGFEEQRALLLCEGVEVDEKGNVDLGRYAFSP